MIEEISIISEEGYNPERVVYVGDSVSDYQDSIKAEIPFLGRVPPGNVSPFPKDIPKISDFFDMMKVRHEKWPEVSALLHITDFRFLKNC